MKTILVLTFIFAQISLAHASQLNVTSLRQLDLKAGEIEANNRLRNSQHVERVLAALRLTPPPSTEGIPQTGELPDPGDVIQRAYTTASLIQKSIDQAATLPLGQRISFFEEAAARIIRKSAHQPTEQLIRITLNRSVDIANQVLPIAGNNPELIAQWLANFYLESFKLAAMWANNPCLLQSELGLASVSKYLTHVSLAEFGRVYSTLLWRATANMTSDSSKAVMLIKLLGYLGWDFNLDLRRRESGIAEVVADVYEMQNEDPNYQNIVMSLENGNEPSSTDLALLRRKIYTILQSLPGRLARAHIESGLIDAWHQ